MRGLTFTISEPPCTAQDATEEVPDSSIEIFEPLTFPDDKKAIEVPQQAWIIFLVVAVWTVALLTLIRERYYFHFHETEYLLGELLHEHCYVKLIHQILDKNHPVFKGANHKTHDKLKKDRPTGESFKAWVHARIPYLEHHHNPLWNWFCYLRSENVIFGLLNPYNYSSRDRSRHRAFTILAQFLTFLFILCMFTNPNSYICIPCEEVGFEPDDDDPMGIGVWDLLNDLRESHKLHWNFPSIYYSFIARAKILIDFMYGQWFDVFMGSCWGLPVLMLIYWERHLAEMVETTEFLCVARMMELANTDM